MDLITGATGFVGSHLAEAALARGRKVRTLVRADSDTQFLDGLKVERVVGELRPGADLKYALDGVDVVFHCAARVGDWGPIDAYRQVNVEGSRALLEACKGRPLKKFIHFSSLGVYAARHHHGTDESEPLPEHHIDGYTQSKVEAEKLALEYQQKHGVPVVILRPGFIYGPRDRTVLPNLVSNLRRGIVWYLGSGDQALNTIYVGNLVDAAFLAVEKAAPGRIFNLTDGERVSKKRFINGIADGLEIARPKLHAPLWLARITAGWMEPLARLCRLKNPPRLTQGRIKFLGLNLDFAIERARRELGYAPAVSFDEGLARTLEWFKQSGL